MDWDGVIEKHGGTLKRILVALVAMAGIDLRGQFTFFPQEGGVVPTLALAEKSTLSPALTLPRRLHRAVFRLLRPAEAAARRLVIVVARGMKLPALTPPRKPKLAPVVLPKGARVVTLGYLGLAGGNVVKPSRPPPRSLSFPLIDPLRSPFGRRRVSSRTVPRIWATGMAKPVSIPPPPSPYDPVDTTRLTLRLQALGRALEDLPAQARRLLRWKARRARAKALGRRGRLSPLRPGRAPGSLKRPTHEVHEVLKDLHYFAWAAQEQPDTS